MTDSNKIKYTYEDPLDFGYVKVKCNKITKPKGFNSGIRNKLFTKTEIYFNEELNIVKVQRVNSLLAKIILPVFIPIMLLLNGLSLESIKELIDEIKKFYMDKKTGSFVSDIFYDREYKGEDTNYVSIIRNYVNQKSK